MSSTFSTPQIRELIQRTFDELGIDLPSDAHETILIRSGHYCGRRFRFDGPEAIWFAEENEIKFYDADGALVTALRPTPETMEAHKKVA